MQAPLSRLPATLVLLCKRPRPGFGKQRLASQIGESTAYQVAEHLLKIGCDLLHEWRGPKVISPSSVEDLSWAESLVDGAMVVPQGAGNLGERINGIDQSLREHRHTEILWIGSDCPSLEVSDLYFANSAMELGSDFHFQPANDGGAVLLANRKPWPPLAEIPWSTSLFLKAIDSYCAGTNATTSIGPRPRPDLDFREDIPLILESLHDSTSPNRIDLVDFLQQWLHDQRDL